METYIAYFFAPLAIAGAGALLFLAYRDPLLFLKLAKLMIVPLVIIASSLGTWAIVALVIQAALVEALPMEEETITGVIASATPGALPILLAITAAALLELGLVIVKHRSETRAK